MFKNNATVALLSVLLVSASRSTYAIDVVANIDGGPTPQALAESIADTSTGVSVIVGSANTTINSDMGVPSDTRAFGSFTNGITVAGTLLPAANQNVTNDAAYEAGIGCDAGVGLCTGVLEDEPNALSTGRGSGVLGPNNGLANVGTFHAGEIVTELGEPPDADFAAATGLSTGGDATVIKFDVQVTSPGFLRVSFVFGSDENPAWIDPELGVNDSFAIIVKGENIATITKNSMVTPSSYSSSSIAGRPCLSRTT